MIKLFTRDKTIAIETRKSGWTKVKHYGKTIAHCLNEEVAREYIYKNLIDKKEYVSEKDFEEAECG